MPIEFRPLVDDTYYRDVKGIFSTAFAKSYNRDTIIRAWRGRNKEVSFAFYDTDLKKVIGFAMMHRSTDTMMYLSYIGMAEDVRGKGLGTKMMKSLLKYAVKQGCSMTLVPFSSVVPWYESLGFSKTCDKFVLVFHNHGTRKQAKYIKALDEEGKNLWDRVWYNKKIEIKKNISNSSNITDTMWFYTRNIPISSFTTKIGISSGQWKD
jgi:N-acetylglutamate synthase-like GNAT family acetyltransferase